MRNPLNNKAQLIWRNISTYLTTGVTSLPYKQEQLIQIDRGNWSDLSWDGWSKLFSVSNTGLSGIVYTTFYMVSYFSYGFCLNQVTPGKKPFLCLFSCSFHSQKPRIYYIQYFIHTNASTASSSWLNPSTQKIQKMVS